MRVIRQSVVALILVLAAGLCPGAQKKTGPSPKSTPGKEVKSLLRLDLLQVRKQETVPPKRNIFASQARFSRPEQVVRPGRPRPGMDVQTPAEPGVTDENAGAPPVVTVNLRYIGHIASARRLVALVLLDNRAIAVMEGDVVGEGIRIGKVSRQQVEVVLPDSSTRTFSLEGEKE